jgi:6-phosphogluconolactonase/glucosamine-6-phosphate isomerase/deaminase
MYLHSTNTLQSWIEETNSILEKSLQGKGRIFLPAGKTPIPLYENWEYDLPDFLEDIVMVQIDEVSGSHQFKEFFEETLPSYKHQFEWIEEESLTKPELEGADVALLGLGLNGHVGFHEPGVSESFCAGPVYLSMDTCKNLGISFPATGLTYGIGTFKKCGTIIIITRGPEKREVLKRLLEKDDEIPATALANHPNLHIINFIG